MSLLGNYSVLHKSPIKFLTGTTAYGDRANWNKPGMMRSEGVGSGNDWSLAAIPHGLGMDGAWLLPKTRGGMTSRYNAWATISGAGAGALGRNLIASGLITLDGEAIGGLIAGGVGIAAITIDAEGASRAVVGGVGEATITIGAVADPGALGWLVGNAPITIDGELVAYAIGWMTGTTEEAGLSTTGIANAVWAAIAETHNESGTMGQKLNAAGSAGDPWVTELPGSYSGDQAGAILPALVNPVVEGALTEQDVFKIILARQAGRTEGAGTGTIIFKSQDGTKHRIVYTVNPETGERSYVLLDVT